MVTTIRIAGGTGDTFKSGTADSSPKERFVFHSAGRDGRGGSSYIDCMLLADRDLDTSGTAPADGGWSSSASGTVSDRIYPLANWRNDTVLILNPSGERLTGYRYSAYGERTTINYGDFNKDGFVDIYDLGDFVAAFEAGDPSADVNRDGFVDIYDYSEFFDAYTHDYSTFGGGLRHLYAGYEADLNLGTFNAAGAQDDVYHVRYRVYETELGRWTRRDPAGYIATLSLAEYAASSPFRFVDPSGMLASSGQTDPPNEDKSTPKVRSPIDDYPGWVTPNFNDDWASFGNCFRYAMCNPLHLGWHRRGGFTKESVHNLLPASDKVIREKSAPGGDENKIISCPSCTDIINDLVKSYKAQYPIYSDDPQTFGTCPKGMRKIAVFTDDNPDSIAHCDQHYYKQEPDGTWTDKPGNEPVVRTCGDTGNPVLNPEDENKRRGEPNAVIPLVWPNQKSYKPTGGYSYPKFCGYMCVP